MINKRQTRKYDNEFKKEALALVKSSDKPAKEIARDLGISVKNIYYWLRREEKINSLKTTDPDESKEMQDLRKELEDVRLERDILKKAVAIFSRQPR